MKRRIASILGASALACVSAVGLTAPPAAAQSASNHATPADIIRYVIDLAECVNVGNILDHTLATCFQDALHDLREALHLPTLFDGSGAGTGAGANAPALKLPANIADTLKTLPSALQTNPVADAPSVSAPITPLLPNLNLGSRAAALPRGGSVTNPITTPIKMLNVASSAQPASDSPVSSSDLAVMAGLALIGGMTLVGAIRRRAAVQ